MLQTFLDVSQANIKLQGSHGIIYKVSKSCVELNVYIDLLKNGHCLSIRHDLTKTDNNGSCKA